MMWDTAPKYSAVVFGLMDFARICIALFFVFGSEYDIFILYVFAFQPKKHLRSM